MWPVNIIRHVPKSLVEHHEECDLFFCVCVTRLL